jgi:hypothetical protein
LPINVAAHEEFELAEQEKKTAIHLRAAGHNRHVETVLRIGAVGHGLKESARLRVRQPIGAELHLSSADACWARPSARAKAAIAAIRMIDLRRQRSILVAFLWIRSAT